MIKRSVKRARKRQITIRKMDLPLDSKQKRIINDAIDTFIKSLPKWY